MSLKMSSSSLSKECKKYIKSIMKVVPEKKLSGYQVFCNEKRESVEEKLSMSELAEMWYGSDKVWWAHIANEKNNEEKVMDEQVVKLKEMIMEVIEKFTGELKEEKEKVKKVKKEKVVKEKVVKEKVVEEKVVEEKVVEEKVEEKVVKEKVEEKVVKVVKEKVEEKVESQMVEGTIFMSEKLCEMDIEEAVEKLEEQFYTILKNLNMDKTYVRHLQLDCDSDPGTIFLDLEIEASKEQLLLIRKRWFNSKNIRRFMPL